jgi:hypothetical protein
MAEAECAGVDGGSTSEPGGHRFCTPACRERHKARDQARRRRYSSPLQQLRAQVAVAVEPGRRRLRPAVSRSGRGESWDLGHAEGNGNGYLGPSHSSCNRAAPRIRENGLVWSRRWSEDAREGTVNLGDREVRRGGR